MDDKILEDTLDKRKFFGADKKTACPTFRK